MHLGIDGNEANVKKRVGSNRYAFGILKALSTLNHSHQVTVYLKDDPLEDMPPPTSRWRYKVIKPARLWTQWRLPLALYLDSDRPDIFYTPGHYAPRFAPMPITITILDLAFIKFPNYFLKHQRGTSQLTQWTAYSVAKAAHIFCISKATQKDVIKTYHVKPAATSVAYPGVDDLQFQVPTPALIEAALNKYHLTSPYLIHVGTLQPRKNIIRIIEAVDSLPQTKLTPTLVLVGGPGWLQAPLNDKLAKVKHKERFIRLGFVPDQDLPTLYAGSLASINIGIHEGFGLPAAEAIASGTIAIIADNASLPEVAGSAGIKVDPYSVSSIRHGIMVARKETPAKRQQRITLGQDHIRQFSWHTSAQKVLHTLTTLTTNH
jgi:glycosyltransferase involved in cell wall biosynthesis